MARNPANALKLVGGLANASQGIRGDRAVDAFQSVFEDVTGWSLEFTPGAELDAANQTRGIEQVGGGSTVPSGGGPRSRESSEPRFRLSPSSRRRTGEAQPLEPPRARELAQAAARLMYELTAARGALRQREAELAAGVPVAPRPDESEHLARRLEAILHGGAEAIGCQVAALYLLDAATSGLKLRSSWGLPPTRLTQPARPLRGSVADLEALVGHVVAIEDAGRMRHWNVPERALAAICVPVSSPTEPLGTLWMFDRRPREFTPEQTGLVEIIAGRLAAELQREMLLQECVSSKQLTRQMERAADWQRGHLPTVAPLMDDWHVQGATGETPGLRTGFYDWFMPADGSLTAVLGYASGSMFEAALTAASLQATVRAHAQHVDDAARLVGLVNEALWQGSAGGHDASLLVARLHPRAGIIEYSSAGRISARAMRRSGVEALDTTGTPLGMQPDESFASERITLARGESLVVCRDFDRAGVSFPGGLADSEAAAAANSTDMLADLAMRIAESSRGEETVLAIQRTG